MLSPHEFATLMLVRSEPDQVDMNRAELDTLLDRQLVSREPLAQGHRRLSLTPSGRSLLDTFSRDDGGASDGLSGAEEIG